MTAVSEWWTYELSDFLLFSPRTYWRMIELYNLAIWPLQLAGLALGAWIAAWLLLRRAVPRTVLLLLAASWLIVAWLFHYERYAQINWAATWFALGFAIEALLLAVAALAAGPLLPARRRVAAATVVAFAVAGYPFLAPLAGRPWTAAEAFGTAATPTAIATLALAGLVRGRLRWTCALVPLAWCAVAAATLWVMNEHFEAALVAIAAGLALVAVARGPASVTAS